MPITRAEVLASLAALNIGDLVIYDGRSCYLRGLEPMSVPDRRAELEDSRTGERLLVPLAEVGAPVSSETPELE